MSARPSCYLLMSCTLILAACKNSPTKTSQAPLAFSEKIADARWLVSGRVAQDEFSLGEVIALALDGSRASTEIKADQSFSLNLDGNNTYALYFLAAPSINDSAFSASDFVNTAVGPSTPKQTPALLTFAESEEIGMRDSLRLPKASPLSSLDLGTITIKGDFAYTSNNPSHKLDFDADGINDDQDPDDQNDGLDDIKQHNEDEQVAICHKEQNLRLPLASILAHLNHGDKLGACEDEGNKEQVSDSSDLNIKDEKHHDKVPDHNRQQNAPPQSQINTPLFIEESDDNNSKDYEQNDDGDLQNDLHD